MSYFGVTLEKIGSVRSHTNADRLDVATLDRMDFQFIVGRDQYKVGDAVLYFPVDSVLPDYVIDVLGLVGKLSGPSKNRVKTIRLRQTEISQGLVSPISTFFPHGIIDPATRRKMDFSTPNDFDFAPILGVTKYEPPIVHHGGPNNAGRMKTLPDMVSHYDIEGADRYKHVAEALMDTPVLVTEKLEGTHFAASILATEDNRVAICSRNHEVLPLSEESIKKLEENGGISKNDWLEAASYYDIPCTLKTIQSGLYDERCEEAGRQGVVAGEDCRSVAFPTVTLRGELIGPSIQRNIYKLKEQEIRFFEIEVDSVPLPANTFLDVASAHNLPTVPVLASNVTLREWLGELAIKEASDGASSLLKEQRREGIVIRPYLEEKHIDHFGRLILKQRSPDYLAGSEA